MKNDKKKIIFAVVGMIALMIFMQGKKEADNNGICEWVDDEFSLDCDADFDIYLPAGLSKGVMLWVAEDGSTYYNQELTNLAKKNPYSSTPSNKNLLFTKVTAMNGWGLSQKDYDYRALAFSVSDGQSSYSKSFGAFSLGNSGKSEFINKFWVDGELIQNTVSSPAKVSFIITQGSNSQVSDTPEIINGDYISIDYEGECSISSWYPEPSSICATVTFTQTSNCETTRTSTGTKSCILCSSNSGCGTNGYVGDPYCDWNDDVRRVYEIYTCNYAGTTSSYCSRDTETRTIEACVDCINGFCVGGTCNTAADLDCNGCVQDSEFPSAIFEWKEQTGDIPDANFPEVVNQWKNQNGC